VRGVGLSACGAAVALFLGCPMATAQGHLNAFVGSNLTGDAGRSLSAPLIDRSRFTWGADVGAVSKGIVGTELDFAYAHHVFKKGPQIGGNYVLTMIPSVMIAVPVRGERGHRIQPYATTGFGLIRRAIDISGVGTVKDNSLGYSLGFGVNGYATPHFGMRVDYRYFRNVGAERSDHPIGTAVNRGTLSFSRGTVGAVFRF
jgi:opacity protein-like surface antigen